jgi:hypothetical protein
MTRLPAFVSPRVLLQPANLLLIAANLVPLAGVILWGWDAFALMILYWMETGIIAFWTVVRIACTPRVKLAELRFNNSDTDPNPLGLALFFTVHAGIFMAVHFFFLWELFAGTWRRQIDGPDSFVDKLIVGTGLWVPLLILFAVRGVMMLIDVAEPSLRRWRGMPPRKETTLFGPGASIVFGLYIRIFVMQFTIIVGAWFALLLGTPGALVFLVIVKTVVDVGMQWFAEQFHAAWRQAKADADATARAPDGRIQRPD